MQGLLTCSGRVTYTDQRDRTIKMWNLGFPEIVIIFIVALVIFGPRKLPELGRSLGKGLSEFKKASNELKRTWEDEVEAVKHEVEVEQDELKKIQTDLE